MSEIIDFKEWFISNFDTFEKSLNGEKSSEFHKLRKDAMGIFSSLSFPTTKDEEWKYTNISPLLKYNFSPVSDREIVPSDTINRFLFDQMEHSLIVFINGFYSPELSRIKGIPEGVEIGSIAEAMIQDHPVVKKHFGKYAGTDNQIFTALSTAFTRDGAFVYVPDGKNVEDPIHIIFLTQKGEKNIITQPRNLFVAGKNSQITIIEHYVSEGTSTYFTNSVTEIFTGENGIIDHIKLQEESRNAFHISRMEVDQERNSRFSSHMISYGALLSRNDFNARFNDEGGECTLNGLFMIDGNQVFDAHTMIDHAMPHCNSHEHYKGILEEKSKGVFNGKVMVRQDAQKTNAFQENNTILLSNDAVMNTKPQLEIFADDVKCSHGATIGKLDLESMFYLKSRGIGDDAATAMLIHAFASDVITSIRIEALRDYIEEIISGRFNQ